MSQPTQQQLDNFLRWEVIGRGLLTFQGPVAPQPPLVPFPGHRVSAPAGADTGRRPSLFNRLAARMGGSLRLPAEAPSALSAPAKPEAVEPNWLGEEDASLEEIRLLLPPDFSSGRAETLHFLASLSLLEYPLTVEVIGSAEEISFQVVCSAPDAPVVAAQLAAHFPQVAQDGSDGRLRRVWEGDGEVAEEPLVVEFGLGRPFMLPLAGPEKADPFVGLVGMLSTLSEGEAGVFQATFGRLPEEWEEHVVGSVSRADGSSFLDDGGELLRAAMEKVAHPLYGVSLRLAARTASLDRSWSLLRSLAAPLRLFSSRRGNRLEPLRNDDYPDWEHFEDVALRRSRRCGMVLNAEELCGLVRFPTAQVRSPKFLRLDRRTRAPSEEMATADDICLGDNFHAGRTSEVWLSTEQRMRHVHVIGASGTGKTTLMLNLVRQDMEFGAGFALLDPHGDLADKVLGLVPDHRVADVVLLDPSDERSVVPFNILSAHSDFEKTLLASDLIAIFRAQSTSWGDQMNVVFGNAIAAFLESRRGGTLADLRRFLLDAAWREEFLSTVDDPETVFYWRKAFPQLGGSRSIGPILTRLEGFLSPKPIRRMVSHPESRLDFAAIMDGGKILLARLPQGLMGRENSHLLGALLMAKLQQMAMGRQRLSAGQRRPFHVYVDEFQHFASPSTAEILSGARKYRLGLVLAHQDLRQLDRDRDVGAAVLANAATRVVFRVSDSDSRALAEGFAHFGSPDLQGLRTGEAICRIDRAGNDFNLTVPLIGEPDEEEQEERRLLVIRESQAAYGIARDEIPTAPADEPRNDDACEASEKAGGPAPVKDAERPAEGSRSNSEPDGGGYPASPPPHPRPEPPAAERERGKGGHQHQVLLDRIMEAAHAAGFRCEVEHSMGGFPGTVDLALFRDGLSLACEMSFTTTVDHEVGNARKCLKMGYKNVALVTGDERRERKIAKAIQEFFGPDERVRILCLSPESFIEYLRQKPPPPDDGVESRKRGWKVKRKFTNLSPEERKAKTLAAFELLATEMRSPPDPV